MTVQTRLATVAVDGADGNVAWSNPLNVLANDGNFCSLVLTSGQQSNKLRLDHFGFTIPTGSTITDYRVSVRLQGTGASAELDFHLEISGTAECAEQGVGWGTLATYSNTLSASLTPAQVNADTLQLVLYVYSFHSPGTVDIDYVSLSITYTPPSGGGGGGSPSSAIINFLS
jgi:hypothetical protein